MASAGFAPAGLGGLVVTPLTFGDDVEWLAQTEVGNVGAVADRCVYLETKETEVKPFASFHIQFRSPFVTAKDHSFEPRSFLHWLAKRARSANIGPSIAVENVAHCTGAGSERPLRCVLTDTQHGLYRTGPVR